MLFFQIATLVGTDDQASAVNLCLGRSDSGQSRQQSSGFGIVLFIIIIPACAGSSCPVAFPVPDLLLPLVRACFHFLLPLSGTEELEGRDVD